MEEFLQVFGHLDLSTVFIIGAACYFMYKVHKVYSKGIIDKHQEVKDKDQQLQQALFAIDEYAAYRQQNEEMQHKLQQSIDKLNAEVEKISKRQDQIEKENKERKVNELRERLVNMHQFYANAEKNPALAWTEMEKEAFDSICKDYELLGGNGFIHDTVKPAMDVLRVVSMHNNAEVIELMHSRK